MPQATISTIRGSSPTAEDCLSTTNTPSIAYRHTVLEISPKIPLLSAIRHPVSIFYSSFIRGDPQNTSISESIYIWIRLFV